MTRLPIEVVSNIIKYLPVADGPKVIRVFYPTIDKLSIEKIMNEIRDPKIFFEDLIEITPYFIDLLEMTGTYLIGTRAYSLFHYVESIQYGARWNFICPGYILNWLSFIDHLESKNVHWSHIYGQDETIQNNYGISYIDGTFHSNKGTLRIRLCWRNKPGDNIFKTVLNFDSTPLQCIVGAYEAVDPYGHLHSNGMCRLWQQSSDGELKLLLSIAPYINLLPISYELHRNYRPEVHFKSILRAFNDPPESLVVRFKNNIPNNGPMSISGTNISAKHIHFREYAYSLRLESTNVIREIYYDDIKENWKYITLPRIYKSKQCTSKGSSPGQSVLRSVPEFPKWISLNMWLHVLSSI